MKKIFIVALTAVCSLSLVRCSDYLETSSPSNADDRFVTFSPSEAFKILSKTYADYRQNAWMGTYRYNDPFGSDVEVYPEGPSSSNPYNGRQETSMLGVNSVSGGFNALYSTISYTSKFANIIAAKSEYQADLASGEVTDWTNLYGEAVTLRAHAYFELTQHFGDVPYGYENPSVAVPAYKLTSRFEIYDDLIDRLQKAEGQMYDLGQGGITGERVSRTYANALIGKIALYAGSWQPIRTDVDGLYGDVQFETKATGSGIAYARRTDYAKYLAIAEDYLSRAMNERAGSSHLITTDEREGVDNPFQRHFQYGMDLEISPETIFEIAHLQGAGPDGKTINSEILYAFGRAASGSNGTYPPKVFAAVRMTPAFYYGGFDPADKRRDVSGCVTGLLGKTGDETLLPLKLSKNSADGGGITLNKWDYCQMSDPFIQKQRQSGINSPILRMGTVYLMLAEAKAGLGKDAEALGLVNQIRARAFGDSSHNLSGLSDEELKKAIANEARMELFGEGEVRWFMIRSGYFSEDIVATRTKLQAIADAIKANGSYTFDNGLVFPAYIYTKQVVLPAEDMLVKSGDPTSETHWPAWRGVYDFTKKGLKAQGHNTAIKGLFESVDDATAAQLVADGYTKVEWGLAFANDIDNVLTMVVSGIKNSTDVPRPYWPIPLETITQSKGKVTNGYGLPNQ
ncbi:MAG: RagB/SusD family nutrient uptake outer membrane protein [Alistipes sp.]|nr:RagB/SusD family nutrient uptake outer membrane protein [Alistipes sp.]